MNGLGAALVDGNSTWWIKAACPGHLIRSLADRATQINPMEVCGVILGLWTFEREIRGRRLLVFIDNQAALGAIRKGRSSVPDFNDRARLLRQARLRRQLGRALLHVGPLRVELV